MSDLREELAQRLFETANPGFDWNRAVSGGTWLMVADECIRQMEWARRHCGDYFMVPEGWKMEPGKLIPLEEVSLTLAPPDWKPE